MELLHVYFPYALVQADNGDIMVGRVKGTFKPIVIPVKNDCKVNLSDETIKEMSYIIDADEYNSAVSFPLDQFYEAVDVVFDKFKDKDTKTVDFVKTYLVGLFSSDLVAADNRARDEVRAMDLKFIPLLLEDLKNRAAYDDAELTLDDATRYIWDHTNTFEYDEIRFMLRTKYKSWFEAECDDDEIAEYGDMEDEEDGTDVD